MTMLSRLWVPISMLVGCSHPGGSGAAPDSAPGGGDCVAKTQPDDGVRLGAVDCMATGFVPGDTANALPPMLPFYQPKVDASNIDLVVGPTPAIPSNNRYTVYDNWNGNVPTIPITSWNVGAYT